ANIEQAKQNLGLKINREMLIRETARKDCYAEIINHLEGCKNYYLRAGKKIKVSSHEPIQQGAGCGLYNKSINDLFDEFLTKRLSENITCEADKKENA